MIETIYVAVANDGTVLTTNTNIRDVQQFVFDYYGINPNKAYTNPGIVKGFHKIEYNEFEDDLIGYWIIESEGEEHKINLWNKVLNETI